MKNLFNGIFLSFLSAALSLFKFFFDSMPLEIAFNAVIDTKINIKNIII